MGNATPCDIVETTPTIIEASEDLSPGDRVKVNGKVFEVMKPRLYSPDSDTWYSLLSSEYLDGKIMRTEMVLVSHQEMFGDEQGVTLLFV